MSRKRGFPKGRRPSGDSHILFQTPELKKLVSGKPASHYHLRLYVAGNNQNSFVAIQKLRNLCDHQLRGRAELEIIDLYQQPELAQRDHIVAAPALIKLSPAPRRMFIGDMTDTRRILTGLGIALTN